MTIKRKLLGAAGLLILANEIRGMIAVATLGPSLITQMWKAL